MIAIQGYLGAVYLAPVFDEALDVLSTFNFGDALPSTASVNAVIEATRPAAADVSRYDPFIQWHHGMRIWLVNWLGQIAPSWTILQPALREARERFRRKQYEESLDRRTQKEIERDVTTHMDFRRHVAMKGAESMRNQSSSGPAVTLGYSDWEDEERAKRQRYWDAVKGLRCGKLKLDQNLRPIPACADDQINMRAVAELVPVKN